MHTWSIAREDSNHAPIRVTIDAMSTKLSPLLLALAALGCDSCATPDPSGAPEAQHRGRTIYLAAAAPDSLDNLAPLAPGETFQRGNETWMHGDLELPPGDYPDLRIVVRLPGATVSGRGARIEWHFALDPEGNDTGVLIEDAPGATIEGLRVAGFNLGVHAIRSDCTVLRDLWADDNRQGMRVDDLSHALVEGCSMTNSRNGNGIDISNADSSMIRDCWIADNRHDGFYVLVDSRRNRIANNWIVGNGDEGLGIGYSGQNFVVDNTILGNGHGILLFNTEADTILNNRLLRNTDPLSLETACAGTVVHGNRIADNTAGITVETSAMCRFTENLIEGNREAGISLGAYAHENLIAGNIFYGNMSAIRLHPEAILFDRFHRPFEDRGVAAEPKLNRIEHNRLRARDDWIQFETSNDESLFEDNRVLPHIDTSPESFAPGPTDAWSFSPEWIDEPLFVSIGATAGEERFLDFPDREDVFPIEVPPEMRRRGNRLYAPRGPIEHPYVVLAMVRDTRVIAYRSVWVQPVE